MVYETLTDTYTTPNKPGRGDINFKKNPITKAIEPDPISPPKHSKFPNKFKNRSVEEYEKVKEVLKNSSKIEIAKNSVTGRKSQNYAQSDVNQAKIHTPVFSGKIQEQCGCNKKKNSNIYKKMK